MTEYQRIREAVIRIHCLSVGKYYKNTERFRWKNWNKARRMRK